MNFLLKENNQVFNKGKRFKDINKELIADEIANTVFKKCGYQINLSGEKVIRKFKSYYLSKEEES